MRDIAAFASFMGASFFGGWGVMAILALDLRETLACCAGLGACACLEAIFLQDELLACADAALAAMALWLWNRFGGGKGGKRRLRAWLRKFKPRRRTAPQVGAA